MSNLGRCGGSTKEGKRTKFAMRVFTDATVIARVGVTMCMGIGQTINKWFWAPYGCVLHSLDLWLGYLHGPGLAPDGVDPIGSCIGVLPDHSTGTCKKSQYYTGGPANKHPLHPEFLA